MATATCHAEGCSNAGQPLEVTTSFEDVDGNEAFVSSVVCGACGNEITDVDPPLPGSEPAPPERPDRPDNSLPVQPVRPDQELPETAEPK
jgi:hypothetical protein